MSTFLALGGNRASPRPHQLQPQSFKSFLLGPLHRHGADLQLRGRLPEREAPRIQLTGVTTFLVKGGAA